MQFYSFGLSCNDSVTSTKTNQDGRFSLNFITDGKSHSYYAEVMPMPNDNFVHDQSNNSNRELKLGDNNNLRLKARELNILKVKIKIDSNPYDTLNISTLYGGFDFYNCHHIDTILYFKVFPLSMNYLYFYNWDSKLLKDRREIKDSINIKMVDTTYYSKYINILDIKID